MRGFWKNTKGAVTVMVTLLLIPAMIVSGSAVDLARIHTVRSIVQDANQLAANSVLTQYDAMLQDIYGLYGVMESDPILGDLLNQYIRATIFGEGGHSTGLGTLQLFDGSGLQPTEVGLIEGQHLGDPQVLRRQIEEYAKYRAPVIVVNEIWDRMAKLEKLKADSDAIEQKLDIDERFEDIEGLYRELYDLINDINEYPAAEQAVFTSLNTILADIHAEMKQLQQTRDAWTNAFDAADAFVMNELSLKYDAIKRNIRALIDGGDVGSDWVSGHWNAKSEWVNGDWDRIRPSNGLDDVKDELESYIEKLQLLIIKSEIVDQKKAELARRIDNLEQKLNSGECSDDIVNGMTKPITVKDPDGNTIEKPSVIEEYRNLLTFSIKPMAVAVQANNEPHIAHVIDIVNAIGYGHVVDNVLKSPSVSRSELLHLSDTVFDIDLLVRQRTEEQLNIDYLHQLAALTNYRYSVPSPSEFQLFQAPAFAATHNKEFYERLQELYSNPANAGKKNQEKSNASKLMKSAQEKYNGLSLTPNGAHYYKAAGGTTGGYGNEGNWGKDGEARSQTKSALNANITSQDGDFVDNATSKLLLLIYDTEMFSNYTTVPNTKTMSGIPMNTDVNYFFQSELEYLFNGNKESARTNVATVSGLILLLRFVSNYVATFVISEIGYELWLISAPAGPFAPIVREVARLGYALAESVYDMSELLSRPSRPVPLMKTKLTEWTVCLMCMAHNVANASVPDSLDGFSGGGKAAGIGDMYYIDYVRIFLLLKDSDTLAQRTGDLISWNLTNKKENIGANEKIMSETPLYNVSRYYTDFSITTSVDLRMLFLSMPFAQKRINGVIPPKTTAVTVTDYRGY